MVHRYSSEQYKHSKLELLVHLLSDIDTVTERALQQSKPLPVFGGWGELAAMVAPDGLKRLVCRAWQTACGNGWTRRICPGHSSLATLWAGR